MSSLAAASLVIGFLVLFGVPTLWLIFQSGPDPEANRLASREFDRRLRSPDLAALSSAVGAALPSAVARLYQDQAQLVSEEWVVTLANAGRRGDACHVAYFQPANRDSLRALGDGTAHWLAFANDGAGDEYLVDLLESDPQVIYLQHDTGRVFPLAATLTQFLELPRRRVAGQELETGAST